MEMQSNKIFYLFILVFLISCKGEAQKKIIESKTENNFDFFNKKYFSGYKMSVDESTPADHPFYSYLNCSNEGYFSIHFIPKEKKSFFFWENEYFKLNKYNYDDLQTENKTISKILNGKLDTYNIFLLQIEKNDLDNSNGCTEESIDLKKGAHANLFLYNPNSKKWDLKKRVKIEILPPYANNKFFKDSFPELYKLNSDNTTQNWDGDYYIKTKVESIESEDQIDMEYYININKSKAVLGIGTKNSIEAYCEGDYSVIDKKKIIHLVHTGESGICTSNIEDSSFDIKKENGKYFIRGKRFLNMNWLELTKNN